MKVEIGFKHADMKSEDANDCAYYAGLIFFFGFNLNFYPIKNFAFQRQ